MSVGVVVHRLSRRVLGEIESDRKADVFWADCAPLRDSDPSGWWSDLGLAATRDEAIGAICERQEVQMVDVIVVDRENGSQVREGRQKCRRRLSST